MMRRRYDDVAFFRLVWLVWLVFLKEGKDEGFFGWVRSVIGMLGRQV
jgi:hypothetical protein